MLGQLEVSAIGLGCMPMSWAYNVGLGISRAMGPARFGAELIIEPIVSNTWAEAEAPTAPD